MARDDGRDGTAVIFWPVKAEKMHTLSKQDTFCCIGDCMPCLFFSFAPSVRTCVRTHARDGKPYISTFWGLLFLMVRLVRLVCTLESVSLTHGPADDGHYPLQSLAPGLGME